MTTSDLNIVLSQGEAVREVHNVKKQSLELNQQFIAQNIEDKKKKEKGKVQKFASGSKIDDKGEDEAKNKRDGKKEKKDLEEDQSKDEVDYSGGGFIDIKV